MLRVCVRAALCSFLPFLLPSQHALGAEEATCLLREGFESGATDFRLKPGTKVVSQDQGAEPHSGRYCLRGNWDPKVTDPVTGMVGSKGAGMDVPLHELGVTTECYVSLWWRLDPGVKFVTENKGQPGAFPGYKLAYLRGTPWDNTVNWVVGQPYGSENWWLVDNVPRENTGYIVRGKTSEEAARPGVWHHVELFLRMNSGPGVKDGVCRLTVDGETVVDRTDAPFMHSTPKEEWGGVGLPSMFGGAFPPLESFGWQLDDLEVWNGVPDRASAAKEGRAAEQAVSPAVR